MTGFPVRVMLTSVWDEVSLDLSPETTLGEIKRRVLAFSRMTDDPSMYVVKYRGAQVVEEGATLGSLGLPRNAALVMLPRRRTAVR
ncbi:MAG: hypothetical protein ABI679_05120 [Gemmatimonadota bacterium]